MITSHVILGITVILYCFSHSLLAADAVKSRLIAFFRISPTGYRRCYNLFAAAGLAACIITTCCIAGIRLFSSSMVSFIVFGIVSVVGIAVMINCVLKYFREMSGLFEDTGTDLLQVSGLHRYVRHPLYAGTFIFLVGITGCFPFLSVALMNGIFILYTLIGIRFEEHKLVMKYGEDYIAYRNRTPMIIPYK